MVKQGEGEFSGRGAEWRVNQQALCQIRIIVLRQVGGEGVKEEINLVPVCWCLTSDIR